VKTNLLQKSPIDAESFCTKGIAKHLELRIVLGGAFVVEPFHDIGTQLSVVHISLLAPKKGERKGSEAAPTTASGQATRGCIESSHGYVGFWPLAYPFERPQNSKGL
jgi:hypothetical protein